MRLRTILAAAVVLATATAVSAQEHGRSRLPYPKSYAIELGTGIQPLHMTFIPTYRYEAEIADKGQAVSSEDAFYPVASLTGVMRTRPRTEFTLTAGASWHHHRNKQCSVFGTDPEGKPRYNLNDWTYTEWMDSEPVFTLTFQWRHLWNPQNAFTVYTALGAGLVIPTSMELAPMPSLTPVAFRYGGRHFYGFAELTLGTLATIVHGGFGWRF